MWGCLLAWFGTLAVAQDAAVSPLEVLHLYDALHLTPEFRRGGSVRVVDGFGDRLTTVQFARRIGDHAGLAELQAMPDRSLRTRRVMLGVGGAMIFGGGTLSFLPLGEAQAAGPLIGLTGLAIVPLTLIPEIRVRHRRRHIGAFYTDDEVILGIENHNATLRRGLAQVDP